MQQTLLYIHPLFKVQTQTLEHTQTHTLAEKEKRNRKLHSNRVAHAQRKIRWSIGIGGAVAVAVVAERKKRKNCFLLQSKIKFAKLYGKLLTQRASKRSCC